MSSYLFQSLFSLPFKFSFISVSLSNFFSEERECLFQNVFFAIKLIFSSDFKTKYQHFAVNLKPNTIYRIPLKFLGLVVVLAKGTLYGLEKNKSLLFNEKEMGNICLYMQRDYYIAVHLTL